MACSGCTDTLVELAITSATLLWLNNSSLTPQFVVSQQRKLTSVQVVITFGHLKYDAKHLFFYLSVINLSYS